MPETGSVDAPEPAGSSLNNAQHPTAKSTNATPKKPDGTEQPEFTNPTLNIINSASRNTSVSGISSPSREGTPPPLPPRPQFLSPRPSTSHSIHRAPSRPQLVAQATTQLSLSTGQAFGEAGEDLPTSTQPSHPSVSLPSRSASDADDNASVRSFMPADAVGDGESILGEVMGSQEKSTTEKLLLRSLGHRFVEAEAQSIFPPDPWFESAFAHEFDEIEDMKADGSNEGQHQKHALYVGIACADVVNRSCHATLARQTQTFPYPIKCWKAHIQPTRR